MIDLPSNPGSYNEFLETRGLEPGPEALAQLSEAMDIYRNDLVAVRGLESLQELHTAPLTFVRPERAVAIGTTAIAG